MGFLARLTGLEQPPGWQAAARERQRASLVRGLLSPSCPVCEAGAGTGCDRDHPAWTEMVCLDRDPPLLIHADRAAVAVTAGLVSRKRVLAQFGDGQVPAALAAPAPEPAAPAPAPEPAPGPAAARRPARDPAGYRSSASCRPRRTP